MNDPSEYLSLKNPGYIQSVDEGYANVMKIRISKDGVIVMLCVIIAALSVVIVSLSSRNENDRRVADAKPVPSLTSQAATGTGEIMPSAPKPAPTPQGEDSVSEKAPPPPPPDEVMALIDGMSLGPEMEQACAEFAVRMAREDPQKGWDWVATLKVPAAFDRAVAAFGAVLAHHHPDHIWKIIDKTNANPRQVRLLEAFSSATAGKDLDRAIRDMDKWAEDATPQLIAAGRRGLLRGASGSPHPEKVLDIFVKTPPSENIDSYDGANLLIKIASVDRGKVNKVILEMPQNDYNATIVEHYMEGMDPSAAGEFVNSMPDGMIKDRATGRVVNSLLNRDPDSAIQWAHSIRDDAARLKTFEHLYIYFKTQNPAFVESSGIASFLAPGVKDRVDGDVYQR